MEKTVFRVSVVLGIDEWGGHTCACVCVRLYICYNCKEILEILFLLLYNILNRKITVELFINKKGPGIVNDS